MPLAVRITKDRKSSFIHLGKNILPVYWDERLRRVKKSHPNSVKLNNYLIDKLKEYNDKVMDIEVQKKDTTTSRIKSILKKDEVNLFFFNYADEYLAQLMENRKYSRHDADAGRIAVFREFTKRDDLVFQEITVSLLEKFSTYLKARRGVSERTVMNYFIMIRTLFNRAINNDLLDRRYYPFAANKIKIKFPPSVKIGLTEEEVKSIEKLELKEFSPVWHARNVWLFSFYFAGIRIADVLEMRWSDFIDNRLVYTMGKNQKISDVKIHEKARIILERYRVSYTGNDNEFIFPELRACNEEDEERLFRKSKSAAQKFNRHLKVIAQMAGINKKLTNHIARHTFGNITGDKISPQLLQKLYRHTDIKTTMGYQSNFIHADVDDALEKVLNF